MADGIKISEMTEVTGLLGSDLIPLVSEGQNRKIQFSNFINAVYPVGSIYLSVNNTSPTYLFGGTWEKIEDRFLIGASSSKPVNSTGGSNTARVNRNSIQSIREGDDTFRTYINAADQQDISIIPPYLSVNMWKRTA